MLVAHPFVEYVDSLITCELALLVAIKYKEPVNKVIRNCALSISQRCTNANNSKLFLGVSKSDCPALMIYQLRTMLDEELSR